MFLSNMLGLNLWKIKKGKTVFNGFIKIVNESNRNTNESWVDQGKQLYNWFMQKWLDNNDILRYSTYNEGTSVTTKRFIKTSKTRIYVKMTTNT